jgi:hypothetical protein
LHFDGLSRASVAPMTNITFSSDDSDSKTSKTSKEAFDEHYELTYGGDK